jgi:alpha-beta hydrolase superfamily lysophospholipase
MVEHSLRYRYLAQRLCAKGFEVWAADARGHGQTALNTANDPGRGGRPGHTSDRNGFFRVVKDIGALKKYIDVSAAERFGAALPHFILGHSWGSFLTQAFIESPDAKSLAGCILSGTRGPGGVKLDVGFLLLALLATFPRRNSSLSAALALGANNRPFKPNRTPVDWLSRDNEAVDAYVADPLCGMPCSSGFYRDLIGGLRKIHRKSALQSIAKDLPIYLFCGSDDPVGEMGASPTRLVNAYRALGIADLEFVLYPGARHEALHETNRDEVIENLINWLSAHIKPEGI